MVSKNQQPRKIHFAIPDRSHTLHTRNEVMKPAHIFRDQVNTVAQWFDQWNDIEQTIACYSLLKRLGPTQARFLSLVLDYTFRDHAYEVQILEDEANGKEFLRSLCHESKEIAVQQLLLHLPLLHPGNDEARHEYLKLLPKILSHSIEYSIHEEECRQLLSLARVHPAFVADEKNQLLWWLGLLEDKTKKTRPPPGFNPNIINTHSPLTGTKSACELWGGNAPNHHIPITSTLSYKTPTTTNGWKGQAQLKHTDSGIGTSYDGPLHGGYNYKGTRLDHDVLEEIYPRPNRSKSFPVDPGNTHVPISPQSSLDSDDENALRKMNSMSNENAHPGMKDIPMWLKSLRLHKYANIFVDLTYEEMLNLSEEFLEKKGVTKGARNKIILCIQKIKERKKTLLQLEEEVSRIGRLPHALAELKNILMTPIKPPDTIQNEENKIEEQNENLEGTEMENSKVNVKSEHKESDDESNGDSDLPSDIIRVMGKASTQLLLKQPDEECCFTYLGLCDRVLSHEAFSPNDKRRLQLWKSQCQKLAKQLATSRKLAGIDKGPRNWFDPLGHGNAPGRRRVTNRTNSLKGGSVLHVPVHRGGPLVAGPNIHRKLGPTQSHHSSMVKGNHQSLSRTKSAPIRSQITLKPPPNLGNQDAEGINKSLETLCLSMTNHALDDATEKNTDTF